MSDRRPHGHYYMNVEHLIWVDVYRILKLYEVTDPCIQHAIKKLLVAGGRGSKDTMKDLNEAIDSIGRAINMMQEDDFAIEEKGDKNNG